MVDAEGPGAHLHFNRIFIAASIIKHSGPKMPIHICFMTMEIQRLSN